MSTVAEQLHKEAKRSRRVYIPRYAMKPKRDGMGRKIEGAFIPAWAGPRQSKYVPNGIPARVTHARKRAA